MCYKNGEGETAAAAAAAAAAAVAAAAAAEDESNERVVVAASAGGNDNKGASASTSAPTTTSGLDPEVAAAAASDWASIPWMTYRRGFPPIRESAAFDGEGGGGGGGERSRGAKDQNDNQKGLTSDVGWGCTLRSGQMLLAAAAQRVAVGRHWRRETTRAAARARLPPALEEALGLFADEPGAPLSVHSLLAAPGVAARRRAERRREKRELERSREADRSESGSEASSGSGSDDDDGEIGGDSEGENSSQRFRGLTPGEWLGPSTFCRAAEAALRDAWPSSSPSSGGPPMRVLVVGGGGGGAPALDPGAAAKSSSFSLSSCSSSAAAAVPLLVLVPVQAGFGRSINPVYAPQVAAALRWPQSVGVVGGRRGASLYFVGTASLSSSSSSNSTSSSSSSSANERNLAGGAEAERDDLGLLYLDPHVPRPAVLLPRSSSGGGGGGHHSRCSSTSSSRARGVGAAGAPPPPSPHPAPSIDPADFFSDSPPARPLPLCSADPSLALGFLCADDEDYEDLVARVARLAARNPRWPLVSVLRSGSASSSPGGGHRRRRRSPSVPLQQEREDAGDWELL